MEGADESRPRKTVGISCSGGGIRAASYALGCLQVLDGQGLLRGPERARYLSAVSGGSYTVGAMAILQHHLEADGEPPALRPDVGPYAPDSPELRRLRNRLTYLTHPSDGRAGEVWRVVMSLAMNLVLFGALAAIVGSALGWVYGATLPQLRASCRGSSHGCSTAVHPPDSVVCAAIALGIAALVVGLVWVVRRWNPGVSAGFQRAALLVAVAAALYALLVLGLPQVLAWLHRAALSKPPDTVAVSNGITKTYWIPASGLAGILAAVGTLLAPVWKGVGPTVEGTEQRWVQALSNKLAATLLNLVAFLSVPALFGGLVLMFMYLGADHPPFAAGSSDWHLLYLGLPLLVIWLVHKYGDLNNWSLHTLYKARLAEAFAVARFTPPTDPLSTSTVPGPENHGSIDADHQHSGLLPLDAVQPEKFPEILLCATSNLSTYGVAPTGTGALSFLMSSARVGGPYVGVLETSEYERWGFRRVGDLTIMDAVSISGAAVSPQMGRMTRPPLRFIMALANLRLGVWLPKPGWVDEYIRGVARPPTTLTARIGQALTAPLRRFRAQRVQRLRAADQRRLATGVRAQYLRRNVGAMPRPGVERLLNEAFGATPKRSPFVYVTDGADFDNLGLVELLKRGCDQIWCIDASGDAVDSFTTLGLSLSIAKAEHGINVEIDPLSVIQPEPPLVPGTTKVVAQPYVIGKISYPRDLNPEEGQLIVVKTGVPRDAPLNLMAFHDHHKAFPCDRTLNQLYTSELFDAYVELGRISMAAAYQAVVKQQPPQRRRSRPKGVRSGTGSTSVVR
jgi:hypothetical protein